jgi:hypothetical protein
VKLNFTCFISAFRLPINKVLFDSRFAHLINVEFFDDLLVVLHTLIESGVSKY